MSNKEILQQNNTRLSENNTDLASILNIVNGLPEKVDIILQEKTVTPSTEQQEVVADEGYTGLEKVTVDGIVENNLEITPSSEAQNFDGIYTNVEVIGDVNLVPSNIKKGVNIFGVDGEVVETTGIDFKINDCQYMFYYGARLEALDMLLKLCENVVNTKYMFYRCTSTDMTELDLSNFDTSNVTDMQYMFYYCNGLTELDLSNFDTGKVTNMNYMFSTCVYLEELDLNNFNTDNVTSMNFMFESCRALKKLNLDNFNTSKVTSVTSIFDACGILTELNLSSFDFSKVTNVRNTFRGCNSLEKLNSFKNYGKEFTSKTQNYSNYILDLSYSTNLTHDSLMDIINNGLYDLNLTYNVAGGGKLYTQSLILGATNLAKLTAEEIAIATNKGWAVS